MKMNTACQLNYVISVAYGIVEYKKYLENVENKWYNTVKVFVYGVTDMNKEKYLVLIDGKDKTEEIEKLEQTEKYYIIKFYNANKTYKYNFSKVVIENTTQQIEFKDNQIVMIDNIIISNVTQIIKYISKIRIIFKDSREKLTDINKIKLLENNNKSSEEEILNYFKELSKYVKIVDEKTGEERYLLEKQYNKFTIPEKSVLKYYLNGINTEGQLKEKVNIYPFNFNISQKQAVENVNKSNISVIKGPPGTGKTQTILNIIANLVANNKTIALVSGNNEATRNVKEKLDKNGYGFIVAELGKDDNVTDFFNHLPQIDISNFYKKQINDDIYQKLYETTNKLEKLLELNNEKYKLKRELDNYKLEQKYFEEYYKSQNVEKIDSKKMKNMSSAKIIDFLAYAKLAKEKYLQYKIVFNVLLLLRFGTEAKKSKSIDYILTLQRQYYIVKIKELENKIAEIERELKDKSFKKLQKEHTEISKKIFESILYEKYENMNYIPSKENYKKDFKKFNERFPVILSTAFSLRYCTPSGHLFDYLIIDEASQVDLLTATLALSCAKNVIVVGDEKQLPQIVDEKIKTKIQEISDEKYSYFAENILTSILKAYNRKIPTQILKEHYRCHPKIIEFCNQRYYDGELIPYENKNHAAQKNPLYIYYPAPGNHMRVLNNMVERGNYNQRELEMLKKEIAEGELLKDVNKNDIGFTTPYRKQAEKAAMQNKEIESKTVHKYQGKEKKVMILSTVLDNSNAGKRRMNFVDDPCLVNVAVSRAEEQFILITNEKLFSEQSNEIKALIQYIKYNSLDKNIINSQIVLVFDLLYNEYSPRLKWLESKLVHTSKYKSENIIETVLIEVLKTEKSKGLSYCSQMYLKNIFKDLSRLTEEERRYVNNNASVDFIIYENDRTPKFCIEVDGFAFHANNPKQLLKDRMKDSIFRKYGLDLIRLNTDEGGNIEKIKEEIEK